MYAFDNEISSCMKFCIITHVNHYKDGNQYFAYAPYVREMNIWLCHVEEVIVVASLSKLNKSEIDSAYVHSKLKFEKVLEFDFIGLINIFRALVLIPIIFIKIYKAMRNADHIHLRCPGNMGLLGCIAQIFFPHKPKTAKYAGNWDSNSKQPLSYRLQKRILSNTFLTKNMQVLVYGEWSNQSKNIKPFFTATYHESDKTPVIKRNLNEKIRFVFAGTLSSGKRPMYALQLVKELHRKGCNLHFDLYGEGVERQCLEQYIFGNKLSEIVTLHGNKNEMTIREAYKKAHFLVLPSKSEGWPKVVAEAMFWGCVPISTAVSCVPNMLDKGNRGIVLSMEINIDADKIYQLLNNEEIYLEMSQKAENWSRNYTLDSFEMAIKKLLLT